MLKKIVTGLAVALAVTGGAAIGGLVCAHRAIRDERPPLPSQMAIDRDTRSRGNLPVRLSVVNTASQVMPRSQVLDADRDPHPDVPFAMSHPAFVIEWPDGRILLVDVGMTTVQARDFGGPIELVGAEPLEPHTPLRASLGEHLARVEAVVFSHLHLDHVGAIADLCTGRGSALPLYMAEAQRERPNFTTRPGLAVLEQATCVERKPLDRGPLHPVPGFPGIFVIAAAGHTPGSQIVLIQLAGPEGPRRFAITGDAVNHRDGIRYDIPKPFLYRLLVVPESEPRQQELRRFLRALHREAGFTLLVNHDRGHLASTGIPTF